MAFLIPYSARGSLPLSSGILGGRIRPQVLELEIVLSPSHVSLMSHVFRPSTVATHRVIKSVAYTWPYSSLASHFPSTGRNGRPNGPQLQELDPKTCLYPVWWTKWTFDYCELRDRALLLRPCLNIVPSPYFTPIAPLASGFRGNCLLGRVFSKQREGKVVGSGLGL